MTASPKPVRRQRSPLDDNAYLGSADAKTGIFALDKADLFNLLCIPPDTRDGDTTRAGLSERARATASSGARC